MAPTSSKLYRLLEGSHSTTDETGARSIVRARDPQHNTVRLTDSQAKALGGRVRLLSVSESRVVEKAGTATDTATVTGTTVDETEVEPDLTTDPNTWAFIADQTGPEVADLVRTVDNRDDLAAIRDVERSNRNRKGVLTAIDEREASLALGK